MRDLIWDPDEGSEPSPVVFDDSLWVVDSRPGEIRIGPEFRGRPLPAYEPYTIQWSSSTANMAYTLDALASMRSMRSVADSDAEPMKQLQQTTRPDPPGLSTTPPFWAKPLGWRNR